MREEMLRIFPGLDAYWDKDDGRTFLEVFFSLYCEKVKFYNRWREMKFHKAKAEPFIALDAEVLRMRLVADSDDFRPYFTESQEEFWEDMQETLLGQPLTFSNEETCNILELSLTRKTTDEINCEKMGEWLKYAFEYQEHGVNME